MRSVAAAAIVACACGPNDAQRAAYVLEAAQYATELSRCREIGRAVKSAGGDGMAAYEACACEVDARHGIDGGCR